ncbi:MAG: anti-sigma factor [Chitinophagales bacterium]|nr:anti-sigma factor [Chitinophagales bacterium]
MKELNHDTLQKALRQLPAYEPPALLWDALETQLDLDSAMPVPSENLPLHTPPADIWANIEARLEQEAPAAPALQSRRGGLWWRRLSAAAAVVLLLGAGWWAMRTEGFESVEVHQEIVDNRLLEPLQEQEDAAFEMVQHLCREQQPVCQVPEFRNLKSELDELTEARSSLREALGAYGNDPELVGQLVEIERERSRILQTLVTMI